MIIAGRAIQGVGGGGIIILANISVSDLFSMRYELIFLLGVALFPKFVANKLLAETDLCTMAFSELPGLLLVLWVPLLAVLSPPVLHGDGASG